MLSTLLPMRAFRTVAARNLFFSVGYGPNDRPRVRPGLPGVPTGIYPLSRQVSRS